MKKIALVGVCLVTIIYCMYPRKEVSCDPGTFQYGWIDKNEPFLKAASNQINEHYFSRKHLIENKQTFNIIIIESEVIKFCNTLGMVYKENKMSRTYSCGTWMPQVNENKLLYVHKSSESVITPQNISCFRIWLNKLEKKQNNSN